MTEPGNGTLSHMQTAFPVVRVLPPPSSGTDILTRFHSPCARLAAYAREAVLVKPVIRHPVLADIVLDLLLSPEDERIELDHIISFVVLDHLH